MARPFRRRKGKAGPYTGNYRQPLRGDDGDVNLRTKDADEAQRRGRLVLEAYDAGVRGKQLELAWSPSAAARSMRAALDPARAAEAAAAADDGSTKNSGDSGTAARPDPADRSAGGSSGAPEGRPSAGVPPSGAAATTPPVPPAAAAPTPLHDAVNAAAASVAATAEPAK